jgi:5-methylcytosine-specific restriction endonuclease McrA
MQRKRKRRDDLRDRDLAAKARRFLRKRTGDPLARLRTALTAFERTPKDVFRASLGLMLSDPCAYCTGPGQSWDHIVPFKHGGPKLPSNFTRACHDCNRVKDAKPLLLFLAERARRRSGNSQRPVPGGV